MSTVFARIVVGSIICAAVLTLGALGLLILLRGYFQGLTPARLGVNGSTW